MVIALCVKETGPGLILPLLSLSVLPTARCEGLSMGMGLCEARCLLEELFQPLVSIRVLSIC